MIYMVIFNDPFYGTLAQEFEKMFAQPTKATYPPYNIVKVNDDKIVMEFAVAGFKKDEISVTTEKNVLSIKADKPETDNKKYLHKGIAARKFTRSFNLPEYFEVESAGHEDGILYIDLIKNVPEEKKPKSIKIK
jgi:molecular chaperone IbpA